MISGLLEQLPGSRGYLVNVANSLRAGRSVVLSLPEHGPEDIQNSISAAVANEGLRSWVRVNLRHDETPDESPLRIVARYAGLALQPPADGLSDLAQHRHFSNMAFWVDGIPDAMWPAWCSFIERYADLSRARMEHERAVLCIPVIGQRTALLPKEDFACTVHPWRDVLGRLDMQLLIASLLPRKTCSRLETELHIAVAAELAGTDMALAQHLASADLATVLHPEPLLRDWGTRRGFRIGEKPSWARGEEDLRDGTKLVHSAYVQLNHKEQQEIRRRVWRGQVGVLFPFLEELRIALLPHLKHLVSFPLETPFGPIVDVRGLELSHLAHLARKYLRNADLVARVEHLAEMRNRLAHLDAVSHEMLAPHLTGLDG